MFWRRWHVNERLDFVSFEALHLEREALRKHAVFSEGNQQPLLVPPHLEQPAIDALVM